ncbi:MAG: insulinase family protein [Armatimonadetes bacterium]|nr:insulinase family protein [Armatimonadota bacterium]
MSSREDPRNPRARREFLAAAGTLVVGSAAAAGVAPKPALPAEPEPASRRPPIQSAILSNGLRLLCRMNDNSELAAVVCLVRAGLPDEPEILSGLAAVTVESVIRGSTTHPPERFERALLSAGGNLRATPGFDFAELAIVMVKEQFEPALKLIADVVAHPRLAPETIAEVKEDLKRRALSFQDDFTGASYQSLTGQLYPNTAYGRAMNGYAESLDRITPADVRRFWEQHYVQNRMVVAVVGDVDANRALNLAQKAFQDVPFQAPRAEEVPSLSRLPRPRVEFLERPGPLAQVMVGFLAPGAARREFPVYAVLDALLGGGKRGRLFANLREKQSLGYEVGSFYQPLRQQSHLVGYVLTPPFEQVREDQPPRWLIERAKTLLLEQYRQVADPGPTPAELARAKAYVVGRYALRQERTRDQAHWLAWNESMGLGRDFDDLFPRLVQAVTRGEVQAAARRAILEYAVVVTVPPAVRVQ